MLIGPSSTSKWQTSSTKKQELAFPHLCARLGDQTPWHLALGADD